MREFPTTCSAVTYDMADENCEESWVDAKLGDLLWNPKMGDGHILVAAVTCGTKGSGGTVNCGCLGHGLWPCPGVTLVCECGQDSSYRDHHYYILARG